MGIDEQKRFRSLASSLAAAFFALSTVLLLVAGSANIYITFATLQNLVAVQQRLTAENAANAVGGFIQEKCGLLEKSIALGGLANVGPDAKRTVLEKLLGKEPSFRQLVLLSADWRELERVARISKKAAAESITYDNNELLSAIARRETYLSGMYVDGTTCEPMVVIAVPVVDVLGDASGALIAEVNLKFMWNLVAKMKIGDHGVAFVVDRKGKLIAFHDISRILRGENVSSLHEVAKFAADSHEDSVDVARGIQGVTSVTSHAHLAKPDWAVVVESPVMETYGPIIKSVGLTAAVMLVSLIGALLAGGYLSRRITMPITKLRDATRAIRDGDLNVKIDIPSRDEIGDLAVSFEQMAWELSESQDKLVQSGKLAAVGQLAAGIAHEINNPLGVILGFAQGMQQRMTADDALRLPVSSIVREALRCRTLVRELLTFSRTGKKVTEEVDLNVLVRSSIVLLQARAATQQVRLVEELGGSLPPLCANKTQIEQIIVNVGTNALDAMANGGTLSIRTRLDGPGVVLIEFADTGTGISPEVQSKIFEPFFTTKPVGKGTGLGLSLVYEIVLQHGGAIAVESEIGKGTKISVRLPTKSSDRK